MFFGKKRSTLNKILDDYTSLFNNWERESFNDGLVDEIIFQNDNTKIIFQEELREHIVNLFVLASKKRIVKIYFREVFLGDDLIDVKKLKKSLLELGNKNNVEKQEVGIYVEFLKSNEII